MQPSPKRRDFYRTPHLCESICLRVWVWTRNEFLFRDAINKRWICFTSPTIFKLMPLLSWWLRLLLTSCPLRMNTLPQRNIPQNTYWEVWLLCSAHEGVPPSLDHYITMPPHLLRKRGLKVLSILFMIYSSTQQHHTAVQTWALSMIMSSHQWLPPCQPLNMHQPLSSYLRMMSQICITWMRICRCMHHIRHFRLIRLWRSLALVPIIVQDSLILSRHARILWGSHSGITWM